MKEGVTMRSTRGVLLAALALGVVAAFALFGTTNAPVAGGKVTNLSDTWPDLYVCYPGTSLQAQSGWLI